MAKFRKKPIVIDAVQFDGSGWDLDKLWGDTRFSFNAFEEGGPFMYIHTIEGIMRASPGDWIIKGVNGEVYPCKSDIFEKTYEPVVEDTQS